MSTSRRRKWRATPRRSRVRQVRSSLERLEERLVLSLDPVSVIDPSRIGLSALGTSSTVSVCDDGQVVAFQSDAPDILLVDTKTTIASPSRGQGRGKMW